MKRSMIASVMMTSVLIANVALADQTPAMETITITYRAPLDYALYQYTTEWRSQYRVEIYDSIQDQAKSSSLAMAQAFESAALESAFDTTSMLTAKTFSPE